MAKKKPDASAASYEAEATYLVKLTRAVPFGGMVLRPCDKVKLKGKRLAGLGDAVESATKLE
jgi:hypothetical protein